VIRDAFRGFSVSLQLPAKEQTMGYVFGLGILWIVLAITLGVMCLRKGHWVMFIIGIFLPFFWLIGAVIPPVRP
jgi:hypothetical protein